jgi:hypothetical protein
MSYLDSKDMETSKNPPLEDDVEEHVDDEEMASLIEAAN